MRKIRLIALALFIAILLCSCSVGVDSSKDTDTSVTTASLNENPNGIVQLYRDLEDGVPALNFGGETIRILSLAPVINTSSTRYVYDNELWVDELTSEPLNDSIYNRNLYVMERFNCKIESVCEDSSRIREILEITFGADEDAYQIIGLGAAESVSYAIDGYYHNVLDLKTDYIDPEAPWWSGQFFDEICNDDEIYLLAGSLSLSMTRSIHATFFNKRIAEEQKVENLYDVVNNGNWTIDYQIALVSGMYSDLDGDDTRDMDDTYGYCSPLYWSTDSYWSAFDIDILAYNDIGEYEFVLNEEKAYNGLEKILALCYGEGAFSNITAAKDADTLFTSGNVFMITQKLVCAETPEFRNMQDDYGILPMPKYDEKQKEYYSMPFERFQTYSVPKTNRNPEMATAILEALSAETWRKVIPVYSEMVLKGKYLSDPQSRNMFDMIITNTRVDAGLTYDKQMGEIGSFLFRYPVENNKLSEFTTNLASKNRVLKLLVKELNNKIFGN
ncbi:MAG: hypothetical protein IKT70_00900 [Clostridia bacterium]|nr:hypothetical protein [Clostridia bacterium]